MASCKTRTAIEEASMNADELAIQRWENEGGGLAPDPLTISRIAAYVTAPIRTEEGAQASLTNVSGARNEDTSHLSK